MRRYLGCLFAYLMCYFSELEYRLRRYLGCYFANVLCYFMGAFLRLKKRPTPSRNWVIVEGEIKRPGNNNPFGNRVFAEMMLFPGRTFGKIPPRNMAGG